MTATTQRIHASCMLVVESDIPADMSIDEYRRARRAAALDGTDSTPLDRFTSFTLVRRRVSDARRLARI